VNSKQGKIIFFSGTPLNTNIKTCRRCRKNKALLLWQPLRLQSYFPQCQENNFEALVVEDIIKEGNSGHVANITKHITAEATVQTYLVPLHRSCMSLGPWGRKKIPTKTLTSFSSRYAKIKTLHKK
jgi:hypothetical protein